jgi:hypothetical protein
MAHDSLAFRFAVVLALAVVILVIMTLAAPPASREWYGYADPVERPDLPGSIFEFVLTPRCSAFCCACCASCGPRSLFFEPPRD